MTSRSSGRVLIVDDERSLCEMLDAGLKRRGFVTTWRASATEAFESIVNEDFDVVLTDLNMAGMNGIELCERVVANRPDVPVVVFTAFGSLDSAIAAIRAGAYDFVPKPVDLDALVVVLDRAIQHRELREEVKRLRHAVARTARFEELIGASPAMMRVYDLLDRIRDSEVSVLITGENGTGKQLAARAIHKRSRRSAAPLVVVNCAAVPAMLLESELFGHVRGAFADARSARTGLLVTARGGTLLLDEIGDMALEVQPKLLRALQERRVRPVGANEEVPTDVRVIATTHRDLESAVEEGRFRDDLYFRINVVQVEMPPLRARQADVLLLAQHFLEHAAARLDKQVLRVSSPTAERLLAYSWPGNVRELHNCMERAVALTRFDEVTVEDLPEKVRNYSSSHVLVAGDNPEELVPMEEVERRYVLRVLEAVAGNKTLAARILGFDRRTLYRKLESYGFGESSETRRS